MPLNWMLGRKKNRQHPVVRVLVDAAAPRDPDWTVSVVCSAYRRPGPLKVLIQCFVNQSASNWNLHILHDTYDREVEEAVAGFLPEWGHRVRLSFSAERHNDYGHSLREVGLRETKGDYVLITNDDNYYPPRFLEFVNAAIAHSRPDVVMFDMVHSHDHPGSRPLVAYSFFETQFSRSNIDMGAAVVRGELARRAGFRDKSYDGDATYFEDVMAAGEGKLDIVKIPRVLLVHN